MFSQTVVPQLVCGDSVTTHHDNKLRIHKPWRKNLQNVIRVSIQQNIVKMEIPSGKLT